MNKELNKLQNSNNISSTSWSVSKSMLIRYFHYIYALKLYNRKYFKDKNTDSLNNIFSLNYSYLMLKYTHTNTLKFYLLNK